VLLGTVILKERALATPEMGWSWFKLLTINLARAVLSLKAMLIYNKLSYNNNNQRAPKGSIMAQLQAIRLMVCCSLLAKNQTGCHKV
jgi:hypothetical protein